MTPAMVEFPNFPVVSPVAQVRGFVSDRELGAEFRAAGVRKGDELAACPGRVREYWNDHRAGMWNALTRVVYRRLSSVNGSHECERAFSDVKLSVGDLRTNLSDETLNAIMMISRNSDVAAYLSGWNAQAPIGGSFQFSWE